MLVSRVETGELVVRLLAARETPTLAFSPDGRRLAVVGGRDLRVFAIPGGEVAVAGEVFYGSPVAWSADGETLVVQTTDSVAVLTSADLTEQKRIPLRGRGQLRALTLARDGRSVSFVQFRRGLVTVDLETSEERLRAESEFVGAVSFDGDRWLVAHDGRAAPVVGPDIEDLGRASSLVAARDADQFLVCWRQVSWRARRQGPLRVTRRRLRRPAAFGRPRRGGASGHGAARGARRHGRARASRSPRAPAPGSDRGRQPFRRGLRVVVRQFRTRA